MKTHEFILSLACLLSGVSRASAQPAPTDIEAQHTEGNRLREQHHDEQARVIFQQLWERTHEARALARMALAEQALGRRSEAEAHMTQALAVQGDPWIQQNRTVLESTLQQLRASLGISALFVGCDEQGAEVFLNGARAGAVNEALRASPGDILFEVRAPGFVPVSRTVTLRPGATAEERVALTRVVADAAIATPSQTPTSAPAPAPAPARSGGGTTRTLAWATGGGALVFLGVGALGYALGSAAADRWNSSACAPTAAVPTRGQRCPGDDSTAQSMGTLAVAGFVGGGALAVTSAVLFALSGGSHREQPPQHAFVGCGVGPGDLGLSCAGRF